VTHMPQKAIIELTFEQLVPWILRPCSIWSPATRAETSKDACMHIACECATYARV